MGSTGQNTGVIQEGIHRPEHFFQSPEEITLSRTMTLGKASVITAWRPTLEAWLDPATNQLVVKFEWNAILAGKGTPYQRDPTVQRFLGETTLDPTVAGKRQSVHLACRSCVSPKKVGLVQGWRMPQPGDAADAA